jgi:hypothetical protein
MGFIFLCLFLVISSAGGASQVSLIEKAGEKKKVAVIAPVKAPVKTIEKTVEIQKPPVEQDFQQMKEFIQQENDRMKEIRILNLDLERADLELRKKEIETKLAGMNKNGRVITSGFSAAAKPVLKVTGIFVNGVDRQVLMNVDGVNIQVKEGESVRQGVIIKKITSDTVLLQYADGKNETIAMGS